MNKSTIKKVTYVVALLSIFVAGLLYMLLSDLTFGNSAQHLILSVLLSFGSGVCAFLSSKYKENITAKYILKGSAVLLAVAYVVFLFWTTTTSFYTSVGAAKVAGRDTTMIISYITGIISLLALIADVVLELALPVEE